MEGVVALFIPISFILGGTAIAITAIMTNHIRKLPRNSGLPADQALAEMRQLRDEVSRLRDSVNAMAIMLDDGPQRSDLNRHQLRAEAAPPPVPEAARAQMRDRV